MTSGQYDAVGEDQLKWLMKASIMARALMAEDKEVAIQTALKKGLDEMDVIEEMWLGLKQFHRNVYLERAYEMLRFARRVYASDCS